VGVGVFAAFQVAHLAGVAFGEPVEEARVAGGRDGGGDADEVEAEAAGFGFEVEGEGGLSVGHGLKTASRKGAKTQSKCARRVTRSDHGCGRLKTGRSSEDSASFKE
jgi:hypothetical protein